MSWLRGTYAAENKCPPASLKRRGAFEYLHYCPVDECPNSLTGRASDHKPFTCRKMLKQHYDRAHQGVSICIRVFYKTVSQYTCVDCEPVLYYALMRDYKYHRRVRHGERVDDDGGQSKAKRTRTTNREHIAPVSVIATQTVIDHNSATNVRYWNLQ